MEQAMRPLPDATVWSQPFWDAAAEHRLVHPWCSACERAFFPPHMCCPRCRSREWIWRGSAGLGTLYSHTVVHRAPQPGFATPYVIGVVDLDEGFELMTNVVRIDPHAVAIGMRVHVEWLEVGAVALPVFAPHHESKELM